VFLYKYFVLQIKIVILIKNPKYMSEERTIPQTPVKQCEEKYPETTAEFKKILKEQYEIFCRKQLNYGPDNISGGTSLKTNEDVRFSLMGLFFRMNDKVQRLKQLVVLGNQDTVGESIDDTYQDLSIYGIIAQIVKRQKWGM
jgi:hypothetical protein